MHVTLQRRVAQVAQRIDAADQLLELEDRPPCGIRLGVAAQLSNQGCVGYLAHPGNETARMSQVDPVLNVKEQNRAVLLSGGSITRTCAVKMSPALARP